MKSKKIVLIILIILLVVLGIYITILYFNGNKKFNEIDDSLNYTEDTYSIDNLPADSEYNDNKQLYGGWTSEKLEVYRGNKLESTIDDNRKVLQISNDDKMEVCYIADDTELICDTSNYSFIDNILYVVSNDLYLSGKRNVIFKDDYLILKSYLDNDVNNYSMLYFIKK